LGQYYAPYATAVAERPADPDRLIEAVGLGAQAEQKVAKLSGGQRRRLDVAIGLIGRPELLFLDEPTAGFDPQALRDFHELIQRLSDMEDTTILLTTHDLDEAEKLADRILVLAGGRIVANGSAEQLAREISAEALVRWSRDGERYEHSTADPTSFVRKLFAEHDAAIGDLEVRRARLEDVYMSLVHQYETGKINPEAAGFGVLGQ
jgi:ABC-2 type transport system ATP-binding protein